ncbi:Imm32 family immunity protein [Streptomyces sp. NRRL F-2747]|uniref:Imm32 family immunity protein n=1 Tax=Streptomyces sp. NRRL F-2747 TaxID=1463843 RepID=UPI003B634106
MVIKANRAGLTSLARHLLTLAQQGVHEGSHRGAGRRWMSERRTIPTPWPTGRTGMSGRRTGGSSRLRHLNRMPAGQGWRRGC